MLSHVRLAMCSLRRGFVASLMISGLAAPAMAQSPAADLSFLNKGVKIVVGAGAGGGNDLYARILARSLPDHMPVKTSFTVVNMPGASSIAAANYINRRAPRDGSEMLAIIQSLPFVQAFGQANIDFDLAKFQWIGNMTDSPVVYITWRSSPVVDVETAKRMESAFGSTTPGSLFSMMPLVMNRVLGTRFKVINGYGSGSAISLALETGEVAGVGGMTWASLAASKPAWVAEKKLNIIAQAGIRKAPDLPDTPLLADLASTEAERAVLNFYSGVVAFARAFAFGPDVQADRVALFRHAFDRLVSDPQFVAEAEKMGMDINPTSGETLQRIIAELVHADPALLARAKEAIAE
jgi:tripartite-type tricarboxylate transporter receptor subunit TctC